MTVTAGGFYSAQEELPDRGPRTNVTGHGAEIKGRAEGKKGHHNSYCGATGEHHGIHAKCDRPATAAVRRQQALEFGVDAAKAQPSAWVTQKPSLRSLNVERKGDMLGLSSPSWNLPSSELFACFGAVLQGDALGVEFATSAHENFLLAHGLLDSGSRIKGGAPFPVGGDGNLFQGLIIDDFFAISSRPLDY